MTAGGPNRGAGGFTCGGGGGVAGGVILSSSDGQDSGCRGGGGGGGGSRFNSISGTSGHGGNGNYGGGGGGSGFDLSDAGSGGFGGGGGASTFFPTGGGDGDGGGGGNGGFGGGGGAGADGPGHGGDFGANADRTNGGGGAGLGGAIFNDGGAIDIRNSTFVSNTAITGEGPREGQAAGGAILSRNGSLTLLNSTLAGNRARTPDFIEESGGGLLVIGDGATASLTVRNSIIFTAGSTDCTVLGSVTSDGSGNLVGSNAGCPGVVSSSDPLLGPFQINPPGITPTLAIPSNSPAFNAGDDANCISTDQRGVSRPQFAHCDIGAYEVDCIALAMTCPANKSQSNDQGQCGAVVTYSAPTVTGDCPPVCVPGSGSFFPIGTTTVTCTADIARCSFTVTVNDTQAPTITCPANLNLSTDPNQCASVVNYSLPGTSDNCPGTNVVCAPPPGSTFQKGTTTINCTATDASMNKASCSFMITIIDTQVPNITCPANITRSTDPGLCSAVVTYPAPTVSDNCPGVGAPSCNPPSGAAFPKGTTTVNCTVVDAANNTSSCAFTVTVNDTEPPAITCQNLNARTSTINDVCAVINFSPVVHDNCPGVTISCNPPTGSCLPLGTTSVSCTATDTSANTAHCAFTVTVFNVCIQDDSNPAAGFLGNSLTGEYRFCCGGATFTGVAAVSRRGNVITFQHSPADRRVQATDDETSFKGAASLQAPPGTIKCTIADRDTRNSVACQ